MRILFAAALFSAYLNAWVLVHSYMDFTNLKCTSLDDSFASFDYCFLKSVNRSYKYMSIKVNMFQLPITEVSITAAMLKRSNGFKPFMYNITFDACKYLKSSRTNQAIKFFFDFFERYSNMNHTCPYDHDLYVEKLPISHMNEMFGNLLPLPNGEYQVDTIWRAYNIPRSRVQIQFLKT